MQNFYNFLRLNISTQISFMTAVGPFRYSSTSIGQVHASGTRDTFLEKPKNYLQSV